MRDKQKRAQTKSIVIAGAKIMQHLTSGVYPAVTYVPTGEQDTDSLLCSYTEGVTYVNIANRAVWFPTIKNGPDKLPQKTDAVVVLKRIADTVNRVIVRDNVNAATVLPHMVATDKVMLVELHVVNGNAQNMLMFNLKAFGPTARRLVRGNVDLVNDKPVLAYDTCHA